MTKKEVVISEYYELLALHKALLEAKFHYDPDNLLVSGSPFVADICNRVVEALIEIESEKDPSKGEAWIKWRDIKRKTFFRNRALEYACKFKSWNNYTDEDKTEYITCLLSPFSFDESDISRFIDEVDAKR